MLHIPSAAAYCALSSVMVFLNKFLLNSYAFNYPIVLILLQTIITVCSLDAFNRYKRILNTKDVFKNVQTLKYQILTALFFALHSITALNALAGLNIPMYATFKRCTPLVNLILSMFLFNKPKAANQSKQFNHKYLINISIVLMTFGAILAGIGDLKFDLNSYLYCGVSVVFQALYLSFIQKCSETESSSMQTFFYSNMLSLPILILPLLFSSELSDLVMLSGGESFFKPDFWLTLLGVLLCGCFLCFTQFWCTSHNSALTTSVIGVLKSFIQTIFGMMLFDAKKNISMLGLAGILVNLFFGIVYTYLKYIEKESKKRLDDLNESQVELNK